MVIACKPGCKFQTQTSGKLDVANNKVICDYCQEEITNISSYAKNTMKSLGLVIKEKPKAFHFKCETCKENKEVTLKNDIVAGVNCNKDCKFNIGNYFIHAIKIYEQNKNMDSENEQE